MCLTIPGKVVEIKNEKFVIDYGSERRFAEASAVDVEVGDFVIVSNRIIVTKVTKERAAQFYELLENNG